MLDETTRRQCPHCQGAINWAATRCKYCWQIIKPLTGAEAEASALPYTNHGEALRLVKDGNAPAIEKLLDERDRLHQELADARARLAAVK